MFKINDVFANANLRAPFLISKTIGPKLVSISFFAVESGALSSVFKNRRTKTVIN